ncbi:hypothetical protein COU57_04345 [Candidatus Pacearchaeota archaeon CG10_big_fil_rev_8_21_14_0_10_32_14]|nr:MAG: hypothetical protein COU57_04345 [Candidatus Pacearchaeota archaeon CG10_big_fil_rev_8_21_14_0_10_32_14]
MGNKFILNGEKSKFEFEVVGYEFDKSSNKHDSDWLMIRINVKDHNKKFEIIKPILLSQDLIYLKEWILMIKKRKVGFKDSIEFMEPDLKFNFIGMKGKRYFFEIYLQYKKTNLSFRVFGDELILENIISYLDAKIKKYPKRT